MLLLSYLRKRKPSLTRIWLSLNPVFCGSFIKTWPSLAPKSGQPVSEETLSWISAFCLSGDVGGKNLTVWTPVSWALSKHGVLVSLAQDWLGGTSVHFTFWRACPLEDNTIHFRRVSYTCSSQQRSSTTNSKSDRATPAFQWCQSYLSAQKSHGLKIKNVVNLKPTVHLGLGD